MSCERRDVEVVNFNTSYRVSVPSERRSKVVLGGKKIEELNDFKYLRIMQRKHREIEVEIRERAMKVRCVIGLVAKVMR